MVPFKRRIKLISPRLQVRLVGAFVGMTALALLLQYLVFALRLSEVAGGLPHDGPIILEEMNGTLAGILLLSFGLLLPVIFWIGVLVTHRIAGPLYHFDVFLRQVQRGERPGPCKLREGDELNELCEILNQVTEPLRAGETPLHSGAAPGAPVAGRARRERAA